MENRTNFNFEVGGLRLEVNNKVTQIFKYLHSIKTISDKKIRSINDYEEVFYQNEISDLAGVTLINNEENETWLEIGKGAKDLYNRFSKLLLNLEKNSESMEIIYGHGLLVGKLDNLEITHPIFTTKMDLSLEDKKGVFTLKPYNNVTNIELDMISNLDPEAIKGYSYDLSLDNILKITSKVKAMGINPREEEEVKQGLKAIVEALKLNLEVDYNRIESLLQLEGEGNIKIFNEPVIILRKVDTRLWNMELTTMIEELGKGLKVPKTVEALISEESLQLSEEELEGWREVGEELLFPLPYNEEQKEITKRLSENFGVVVQGPPGTGKSHTIVNLISHLLAHGKRVLVTSQTDRALKVLNNKIPEEIRSLCMSILGDDSKAMEELDEAVRKITENLSLDTAELKKEFKHLKYRLRQNEETQKKLLEKLKEVYTAENSKVNYQGNNYFIAEMAKFLSENVETSAYIEDEIELDHENPITSEELKTLLILMDKHPKDTIDFYEELKEAMDKLPNFKELISNIESYKNLLQTIYVHRGVISGWSDKENTSFTNSHLISTIEATIETLKKYEDTVMESLFNSIYEDETKKAFWQQFVATLKEDIANIYRLKASLNRYKITLPQNVEITKLRKDFEVVHQEITSKGKVGTIFKLFHKEVNYILQDVLIDGEKIFSLDQSIVLKNYLDLIKLEKEVKNYYNAAVKEYGGLLITAADSNFLNTIQGFTLEVENILNFEEGYKNKVINLLRVKYFSRELNFYKRETYEYIKKVLTSLKAIKEFESYEKYLEEVKKALNKYPQFRELALKVEEQNLDYIKRYYSIVEQLLANKEEIENIIELREKLNSLCPIFGKALIENKDTVAFDISTFKEALKYSAFNGYIKKLLKVDVKGIEKALYEEKIRENELIREIVSKQAWYNQIQRTTETQKRSLFTWMEAIKRIGKGTGTQAIKYRKIAQREMENCKDVIPVWIMPINRVIENLKVNEKLFDVVIVDESSQSDVSALTVLMRAERAVIVGDEKQISPEAIGKNSEKVEELIDLHLKDIPHREWFDLKTSLYNTAQRVFPNRLVLKEHFRSVEEIIGFSNNLCYSKEIIPLRCSTKGDTLTPSILTIKVEEGFKDGTKAINLKEAFKIVEAISNSCKSPNYEGMSMGVISLLGEAQAELIENMLIEKIGIEEIVKRNIVCGDAYSFQGDERDVMFLSMVVGSNAKFGTLSKDSDIRRFNVAASRAKSQMWLFHSVDLEELSPKCVRHDLLSYMINYKEIKKESEAAATLLLSSFEEDLQYELYKEKLNLRPHFTIGKYTVDFVVEGKKKVAIKTIGDNKEIPYDFEEEYNMQHTLERAGWKFLKVRSSEFYLKRDEIVRRIKGVIV